MAAAAAEKAGLDRKRLALVELALLLLALGLVLLVRAQMFQVHIQGSFGDPDTNISTEWVVGLGLMALIGGVMLLGLGLGSRFTASSFWAILGLVTAILLLVIGLVPFPSWDPGVVGVPPEQTFDARSEPALFSQEKWYNVVSAVAYAFACFNLLFLSLHELAAPRGSPLLPREGMAYAGGGSGAFGAPGGGAPLLQCPSCLRRFVATGDAKHCPGCGQPLASEPE